MSGLIIKAKASRDFLDEAKEKGLSILLDMNIATYFMHNVDLWRVWFNRMNIRVHRVTGNFNGVKSDDLCIVLAHCFSTIPVKTYIAIQTENLTNIYANPMSYKNVKVDNILSCLKGAVAIWDYSLSNIQCLAKMGLNREAIEVPIMFSDNSRMIKMLGQVLPFKLRPIDVIISSNTPRRQQLCEVLKKAGLVCATVWRTQLPMMVTRAKIFLNSHAYDGDSALEVHRLLDLRNMPIVVISEKSADVEQEKKLDKIPFIQLHEILDNCLKLCKNESEWSKCKTEQTTMWSKLDNDSLHEGLEKSLML